MSIVKILPERIERGSAVLRNRPSPLVKELVAPGVYRQLSNHMDAGPAARAYNVDDFGMLDSLGKAMWKVASGNLCGESTDVYSYILSYMTGVTQSPNPIANSKRVFITRFDPPFTLNDVSIEKTVIVTKI
jgi:hypothetical protein